MEFFTATPSHDVPAAMATPALGSQLEDYTTSEITLLQLFMGLLTVCGVSLNAIIIYLYCITPKLYTKPMNLLFISLTMADFTVSVCATFTSFVHTLLRSDMSEKLCGWYAFFATFAGKKLCEWYAFFATFVGKKLCEWYAFFATFAGKKLQSLNKKWINIAHDAGHTRQRTNHSDAKPKYNMNK